jgi:hypothetical protein
MPTPYPMPPSKGSLDGSALPPIPADHGFCEGDNVEMPLYGGKKVQGKVTFIDVTVGKKRYRGLAVLGSDGRFYEFHPEIAKKL